MNNINKCFVNRELSFLKFNKRVLQEVDDESVPLFEKLKFISIFCSNLDEFFMIRVGSLYEQSLLKGAPVDNKTGWNSARQLKEIYSATTELYSNLDASYEKVSNMLNEEEIYHAKIAELNNTQKQWLRNYFKKEIFPLLSPQIVDAKHPFPHLINKQIYIITELKSDNKDLFGIIPLSRVIERIVYIPKEISEAKFIFLLAEDIILNYIKEVFKLYKTTSKAIVRVTRNADITAEDLFYDEDTDFREYMNDILKKRRKLAPVRLEITAANKNSEKQISKFICSKARLSEEQIFVCKSPLDQKFIFSLYDRLLEYSNYDKRLYYPAFVPQIPKNMAEKKSVIEQIKENDIFLSYPYHSMKPYLHLLEEAAGRNDVVSIKITLYRLSTSSRVVEALCQAAENGIDVTVVVELKARFDEEKNINWSRRLEEAGCNVIYGVDGFKVHSKITLITIRTPSGIEYITHFGTGNYNENTAKLYTDLSVMTADREIGADTSVFFNSLSTSSLSEDDSYSHFISAPHHFKMEIINLIRNEVKKVKSGIPARIRLKMNSVTDKDIMEELIFASQAGVKIDMIIRGICCLLPGIENFTDNISITSIVGRFLEHSRIFIFGDGNKCNNNDVKVFISSADFMTRNTTRRVELAVPIFDGEIISVIIKMFDYMLKDTAKSRKLYSNFEYEKIFLSEKEKKFNSQEYFCRNMNNLT